MKEKVMDAMQRFSKAMFIPVLILPIAGILIAVGNLFTNSILNRDYTLIMGITVFFAVILVICILVVDILYVLIDPRIKYQ